MSKHSSRNSNGAFGKQGLLHKERLKANPVKKPARVKKTGFLKRILDWFRGKQ